jgi:hypothetical protein
VISTQIKKGRQDNMLHNLYRNLSRCLTLLVVCSAFFISAGCAQREELTEQQLASLEQRVNARWEALMARDFEKAWEFTTPEYRAAFPRQLYPLKFSYTVEWELTGIEVRGYDSRAAVASVAARVMSKPTKQTSAASRAVGAVPVTFSEQWILIDGEWWFSTNS